MTDLITENARLRAALDIVVASYDRSNPMRTADMHLASCRCLRCTVDEVRAALATPAPDAVQEAARVLLSLSNEAAQPALDACHGHYGQVAVKEFLRAIAGDRT